MKKRMINIANFILMPLIVWLGLFDNVVAQENQQNPVTVDLITIQNPVAERKVMTWYVTVSPAITESINSVSFQLAADGQWAWENPLPPHFDTLTTTQSFTITAVPLISGELTPIINVTAQVGKEPYSFFVSSKEPITINPIPETSPSFWSFTMSERNWEVLVIFVSVLLGALVTLITQWLKDWLEGKRQKKKYRGQVNGILINVCINTKYAAENLSTADISILKKLFENEGLYDVLSDYNLTSSVEEVWEASEAHNFGLDKPGGFERATVLSKSTATLSTNLKKLRYNWFQRIIERV